MLEVANCVVGDDTAVVNARIIGDNANLI